MDLTKMQKVTVHTADGESHEHVLPEHPDERAMCHAHWAEFPDAAGKTVDGFLFVDEHGEGTYFRDVVQVSYQPRS